MKRRLTMIAVLASVAAIGTAMAAEPPCTLRRITSVPAHADRAMGLVVDATINELPAKLVIDTGVGYSALTHAFAERQNLPLEPAHIDFRATARNPFAHNLDRAFADQYADEPTNHLTGESVAVSALFLGAAHTVADRLQVLQHGSDGIDQRPVGLIGTDFLISHDIEFDATDGRLNLFEPLTCNQAPVYWSVTYGSIPVSFDRRSGRMTTPAILDGTPVTAVIDTGSGVTKMPLAIAQRKFGVGDADALEPMAERAGVDGITIRSYRGSFHRLELGGLAVRSPLISLDAIKVSGSHVTGTHIVTSEPGDLTIGMDLLKRLRSIIDYGNGQIYYTVAEPAYF